MRFRFVHAADLHLDTPFEGLSEVDSDLARRLRDASLAALDRIVAKALEVDAAFVVFAGDIYDGEARGIRAQLRFRAALERLAQAGVQAFIAHGNHDPEGGRWTAIRTWPEGVTVFPSEAPAAVEVRRGGDLLATVHGISYGTRRVTDNLALRFPVVRAGGALHVAVLHCNLGDQPGHAPYSPCSLADLRSRGMGYWALGHVHRRAVLARDPWVVYPGNTQGRSFGPGELGDKGAVVVHVADGSVTDVTPFATDTARFHDLAVSIEGAVDLAALADRLRAAGQALRTANPGLELLVRGRLTGRGDLHRVVSREQGRAELLEALADLAADGLWWQGLVAATRPSLDLDRLREGGDLRAAVLATEEAWRAGPPAELLEDLRAPGQVPSAELLAELLADAAYDVLDRLSPEPS